MKNTTLNLNKFNILLGIFLMLVANNLFAQLTSNYPSSNAVVATGGSYADLGATGSVISTPNNDDAVSASTPIGFTFSFNGVSYTDFILSTNGFIKLGTLPPSATNLFTNTSTAGGVFNSVNVGDSDMVVPFCTDLEGGAGVEYRVLTSGAAPNRVCTIQWKNVSDKTNVINKQYAVLNFQIKLYETTNIIEFVYGSATTSGNATSARWGAVGLRGKSNAANQLVVVTKGSVQTWDLATILNGNYTGNGFNFGNGTRPLPISGLVYRFVPMFPNDIAVRQIYTLGKLPIAYTIPHFIRAAIRNSGSLAQTNFYVRCNITGANSYADSVMITNLNPGVDTIVTFPAFSPFTDGTNNIVVSVASDQNNSNNSRSATQFANQVVYSYADPTVPAAGGVGFTGGTGDFVAKFPYSGSANAINQVGVNFFGGGVSLRIGIWARNPATGLPGALLWQSAVFTTTAGLNTIPINPAVIINDTFFAGVIQTSTTNANFAFQNEVPIRNQTFFYTAPTGNTTWTDFFTTGSNFRFMIEPRLQSPNDVGFTRVLYPCQILPVGQASFSPTATIYNYGVLTQTNVPVTCRIFNSSNTQVYSSTTTISSLATGASTDVTFPSTFSTTTPGNYTIKVWSSLAGDGSTANDTAVSSLTIFNSNNTTSGGTRLQFDGVDDYVAITSNPSIQPSNQLTLSGWINVTSLTSNRPVISKDSANFNSSFSLTVNTVGQLIFSVNTTTGFQSLNSSTSITTGTWNHIAATYDNGLMTIFINGDTAGTFLHSGSIINNNGDLFLGRNINLGLFYNGGIDEFKLWTTALTSNQIRRAMHIRDTNFSSPNLKVYLRFDEGVNSLLLSDASGNCNNGTLINMDAQNSTAVPAWFISNIPIGSPVVDSILITSSGAYNRANLKLNLTSYNYSGSEIYYIHMFDTVPYGTPPTTNPGGIAAAFPRNWIIYRYGGASYDSIYANFILRNGALSIGAQTADISLFRRSNGEAGAWTSFQNPASALNVSTGTVTFKYTNPSQFRAQFSIGGNNNPLPVTLLQFNAKLQNKDVLLNWATAAELNNRGFEVERSVDGKEFQNIGFVEGKNNSNSRADYQFNDASALAHSQVLYYRLKQLDFDGKYTYSDMVRVQSGNAVLNGVSVSPNPFSVNAQVQLSTLFNGAAHITISDVQGRVVLNEVHEVVAGNNAINLQNMESLKQGVYFMRVSVGGENMVVKMVKSDK